VNALFTKSKYEVKISRNLMAPGFFTSYELTQFFLSQNPGADEEEVQELAFYYVYEGLQEGVNYTVAFAQMCLETGYLKFGNLVISKSECFDLIICKIICNNTRNFFHPNFLCCS